MTPIQMFRFDMAYCHNYFRYQSRNAAEHKLKPQLTPYHRLFNDAAFYSFRSYSKKSFYAFLYGSFSEEMTWNDYFNCYLMGGEL